MYTNQTAPQLYSQQRTIVLLPMGSCEQHGPHLPIDTDLRIAQLIAEKLTKSFSTKDVLLLPSIPFSCSWEHKGLGTIALNTNTVSSLLYDIVTSLKSWHMPIFLVIINWHGGNSVLASLTTEITAREEVPTTVVQTLSLASQLWRDSEKIPFSDIHAGMIETSVIQAYWPELIIESEKIDFIPDTEPASPQSIFQTLGTRAISKTGIWGKPLQSNPEKGRYVIDKLIEDVRKELIKLVELIKH